MDNLKEQVDMSQGIARFAESPLRPRLLSPRCHHFARLIHGVEASA
jgi:hypothetical protein